MLIKHIPAVVLEAAKERGLSERDILSADPKSLFIEYCEWNGLIRWGDTLWDLVEKMSKVPEYDREGFLFKGFYIQDPFHDETGRFPVDPEKYYGDKFREWRDQT